MNRKSQEKFLSKKINYWPWLFIAITGFFLYVNTINHQYALDDDVVFKKNRLVQQGVSGIKDIVSHGFLFGFNSINEQSYRPLVTIVFALEYELFGNNPKAGHTINILLYIICGFLLYAWLLMLFKGYNFWIPFAMTLLWMAHPIHTEAVANIKGRDDILHFIFIITALWQISSFAQTKLTKHLLFSLLAFFGALLCKEMAVTFIVLIPIMLFVFYRDVLKLQQIALSVLPFIVVFGAYMLLRNSILDVMTFKEGHSILNNALAASENETQRIASAIVIFGKYLGLLFFPHPLSFDYSYNQIPLATLGDWRFLFAIVTIFLLTIYAGYNIIKQKGAIGFGILFFFITLSIVSNIFIMIGAVLGERFLFTPSVGFVIAVPLVVFKLLKIDPQSAILQKKNVLIGLFLGVMILYSFKTIDRNEAWENNGTLFAADVISCPNSTRTHASLASFYREIAENSRDQQIRQLNFEKAIPSYKKSLKILPSNADTWYNLGVTYSGLGQLKNAKIAFEKAVKHNPKHTNGLNNLGVMYFQQKDYNNALKYFTKSLEVNDKNVDALANIGAVYHNSDNLELAVEYYERALVVNPNNLQALQYGVKAYNTMGNTKRAKQLQQHLQRIQP